MLIKTQAVSMNGARSVVEQEALHFESSAGENGSADGRLHDTGRRYECRRWYQRCRRPSAGGAWMARLLVVDDDPQMLSLSKRYLAGTGYDILTAADFRDARMQIQLFEPAIIVADVRLGEYNGVQLALLALEAREDAGVVLMSGHADVVLQQEARQ